MLTVSINGISTSPVKHERLIELVNRNGHKLPQVYYHPQLGPIQPCDTCTVEVNGKLVRAWGIVRAGSKILEIVIDAAKSLNAIRGMRNVLILSGALGNMDPDHLREVIRVVPDILAVAAKSRETEPPSLLQNFRTLSGRSIRRGLAVLDGALEAWSKNAVGGTKAANAPK